jgi:glycosyltransferase involved in cell wall biosynthesis
MEKRGVIVSRHVVETRFYATGKSRALTGKGTAIYTISPASLSMKALVFVHTYSEKNGIALHVDNLAKNMPKKISTKIIYGKGHSVPLFSSLKIPVIEVLDAAASDFDVMHVHGYGNFFSFFGALVSFLKAKPLVWTIHGYPKISGMRKVFYYIYRYLMAPLIFWRASRIVSVSSEAAAILREETSKKIQVVPNGVDLSFFRSRSSYRSKNAVCYVGRLDKDKGVSRMLECKSFPLLFIGPDEGKTRRWLEKLAASLRLNASFLEVEFQNMPSAYERCRYVVLPSKYEGFPLTLLESLSMGRPFVSTDVGEIRAVMEDLGLHAEDFLLQGSVEQKLSCLEKMNLERRLHAARRRLKKYSWHSVAASVARIYAETIRA